MKSASRKACCKRYGSPAKRHLLDKARAQVRHELALIAKLGFAGYFLIVWDIIRYCQQERDSGAGPRLGGKLRRLLRA